MSLSVFPAELLHSICIHLPKRDLVSVASTNFTLCAIAQRLLYRHISITVTPTNRGVVTTLATRPDISQFVRTLSLTAHEHQSAAFYHLLTTALAGMTKISSLDLFVGSDTSYILSGRMKERIEYPCLSHFACSFPFDNNVANFLGRCPEISEMEVNATPISVLNGLPRLSPNFIPHLSHFQGPSHVAEFVVPGRPVEVLYLSSGILDESVLQQLAKSTSPVVLLDAITSSGLLPCLEAVANNMPSLCYLRLMTTYGFGDRPDLTLYEQVAKVLSRMPELSSFELSGMNWTSWVTNHNRLSDGKRMWQSRPPSPRFPPSNAREGDDLFFEFSENLLLF